MIARRRFLQISAAALAVGSSAAQAAPLRWQGTALGADVSLTLRGPRGLTRAALTRLQTRLDRIEDLFSLYRPQSALVRLNRDGVLTAPAPMFLALCDQVDALHHQTRGLFDPSVQGLFVETGTSARWTDLRRDKGAIRLARGQQLTFNGIAQGFATDLVTRDLRAQGFGEVLVNIGEMRAMGGPWRIGISDPAQGMIGHRRLHDSALATSSPGATQVRGAPHIQSLSGTPPLWSTVSVQADHAALADGLSTAMTLMPLATIRAIARSDPRIHSVLLVDAGGDVTTV